MPPYIPAHFTTAASLVNVFLIAGAVELRPVVGQDIGRDDFGVVFQQAQRAAEPHAIVNDGIGNGHPHLGRPIRLQRKAWKSTHGWMSDRIPKVKR